MLVHILDTLCLRALGSPALGRAVRAVIVAASRDAASHGAIADGGAGTMVMVR